MEDWGSLLEKFGLPVVMLLGMSWGAVHLFKWMANDLMRQLQENATRIEAIVVKLISNSKEERIKNDETITMLIEEAKSRDKRLELLIDVIVKLTGNGLKK